MPKKLLIVEDEFIEAENLERVLSKAGYVICGTARSVPAALSILDGKKPDFVLIDVFLKGPQTGIDLARTLRERGIPFLYISANSDRATLDAIKDTHPLGFLVKPFRERDVLVMLEIALYQHEHGQEAMIRRGLTAVQSGLKEPDAVDAIIGQSPSLLQVLEYVRIVAPTSTSVLIMGESGTGKERIAQALHELSPRRDHPFIKVNCAALPLTLIESILFGHEKGAFTDAIAQMTGKFEQAEKGTLFLDEIGEMPMGVQVKLLRALQEKEIERVGGRQTIKVDVRIVAATNRNLDKEVEEGRFRLDLYYRLNVFPIRVPSLRERREDIPLLVRHFIHRFCGQTDRLPFELPPQLSSKLSNHHWPGNIRELENLVQRMVLLGPDRQDTGLYFGDQTPAAAQQAHPEEEEIKTWQEYERAYILYVLKKCNGKISGNNSAAQFLNLAPTTLASKMKRLGIERQHYCSPL
ncbi:MAG: sigma-54-dependent Fis family transcriptional regulator [Bacteroidetes bacterium]|nr:sigma-54-dependent Fis family transcriptional regulator [Bacteroidota bacterium]